MLQHAEPTVKYAVTVYSSEGIAEAATVDVEAVRSVEEHLAAAIGFRFEDGQWFNRSNQPCSEEDAGYAAFYCPTWHYDWLTSAGLRSGWLEAEGFEDYSREMFREDIDTARFSWMA